MANPSKPIGRNVTLPWAAYQPKSSAPTPHPSTTLAITVDGVRVRDNPNTHDTHTTQSFEPPRLGLDPTLATRGLPVQPLPVIPVADRGNMHQDSLMGIAVTLDVLATILSDIEGDAFVLQRLAQAWTKIGALGGLDQQGIDDLIGFAQTQEGDQRAHVSKTMMEQIQLAFTHKASINLEPIPSRPMDAYKAVCDTIHAAHIVVREAILLMQAQESVDYRQA